MSNRFRRWLSLSMFGTCSLVLCIVWLGAVNETWALEPEESLRAGEAFVIIKVTGDVNALSFQQFQGTETFVARRHSGGSLVRVKPGRYYLKSATPVHMGIRLPPNPEPPEPSQTIVVREGMVNYIGDWKFKDDPNANNIRYNFERKFDLGTVTPIVEKYGLSKYGLMVSKLGELPVKTAMPTGH